MIDIEQVSQQIAERLELNEQPQPEFDLAVKILEAAIERRGAMKMLDILRRLLDEAEASLEG